MKKGYPVAHRGVFKSDAAFILGVSSKCADYSNASIPCGTNITAD